MTHATIHWKRPQDTPEARRRREAKIAGLLHGGDDDVLGKAYDGRLVARLFGYVRPYRRQTILAVILMGVSTALSVSGPWFVGHAVDGAAAGDLGALRLWSAIFAVAAVAEWLTNRQRVHIMAFVGTRVITDLRSQLFRHLHSLSLNFHNNMSVGRLMSRLIGDVGVLQEFITWSITGLTRSTFNLVGISLAMIFLEWRLALTAFALLPLMVLLTNYWRRHVRDAYRATRQRLSIINGFLNESIAGVRVTRSFNQERRSFWHFDDLNRSFFDANVRATRLSAIFFPGVDFLGSLAAALVVGVGGWLVMRETLSAGVLVAFVLYVERFFDPIRELAQRYNTFQATMASSERVFSLLDTPPDLTDAPDAVDIGPIEGRVDFEHVSFRYKDNAPVLEDITIHAEPGQRIALVGETGAGKSTVIRLLARFFDVTAGAVMVDGHDVRRVTLASLRSQMGIVLQDPFLFSATIADNIRYGRLDATDEEVIAAAKAVGAHDFIMALPEGYATRVEENGGNLSAGQRQILAFARALLANPRILILDEATSNVDTATEQIIQRAMDTLMAGRTSFVIAHRLSTIVNADQIIVMERGRIVEQGSHQELLARRGRYYHLYTMQWRRKSESAPETQAQ
ncbi:MAG: ABC transporter ATP-binding protein [Caldilinea sp.]